MDNAGHIRIITYPKNPKVILTVTTSLDVFITDHFHIMQHHAGHESMDPMKFLGIFDASNV